MSSPEKEIGDRLDGMEPADQIRSLTLDVEYYRRELQSLNNLLVLAVRGRVPLNEIPQIFENTDQEWRCPCGTLMGLYNKEDDVLRIRAERFHMIIHTGLGGWLQKTCHKCARILELKDEPASVQDLPG